MRKTALIFLAIVFGVSLIREVVMAIPLPDSAAMLLVGTGMIGLAGVGRKKLSKK